MQQVLGSAALSLAAVFGSWLALARLSIDAGSTLTASGGALTSAASCLISIVRNGHDAHNHTGAIRAMITSISKPSRRRAGGQPVYQALS